MSDPTRLRTWVLSDGKPGMENQCVGLAEVLGVAFEIKRISGRQPWRSLPPALWWRPLQCLTPDSAPLTPPWPDLLIATGRQSVAPSIAVRRAAQGQTFTVQIQNPGIALDRFDLVVTPQHDRLSGPNVIETYGALGRVTPVSLTAEAEKFRAAVAHLPRPLVMVSVGGDNKVFRLTEEVARALADGLRRIAVEDGAGLLVTPSRRTGPACEALLRAALQDLPHLWWDGEAPNPYLGWLGLADAVVVTGDSVNMVSEACVTGKPVFVHDLEGGSDKFARFHAALRRDGLTRRFEGRLVHWTYPPLNDTATVAAEIAQRLGARHRNLKVSAA